VPGDLGDGRHAHDPWRRLETVGGRAHRDDGLAQGDDGDEGVPFGEVPRGHPELGPAGGDHAEDVDEHCHGPHRDAPLDGKQAAGQHHRGADEGDRGVGGRCGARRRSG
jgi:hypothetical protein